MSARAGVVITGTEVLTGRVRDRNGPWLADRLLELGVELAHITICGDRPEDMMSQLRFMADQGVDLVITSGGLGPTADDLTTEIVADFSGRPLRLDGALEARIVAIVMELARRWRRADEAALRAGARKQALVPDGATVLEPAGTAPGLVVPPASGAGPTVVVLPGPPRELHAVWAAATATAPFADAVRNRARYRQRTLRLVGVPESEITVALDEAAAAVERFEALEVTTCVRRGELEVVVRHEPEAESVFDAVRDRIARRYGPSLYSPDGSSVDEQVAELLTGRRLALAESCTAGLMAARFTERPGASAYVIGGLVTYADEAKVHLLDVDPGLVERHGAVSREVADAMAQGALARLEADVALAITGVAGPGGGTERKPVGYVCFAARTAAGDALVRDVRLPGDRDEIRDRSTTVGMHLVRALLRGEEPPL